QMELGNLTNNMLESSPFVHVFSPVFLGQVNESIFNKLVRWINSEGEIETIMPLKKLIALDRRSQSIEFNDLVKQLREAYRAVLNSSNTTTDVHSFFLNLLDIFVDALPSEPGSRHPISPRNIIPLHIYQKNLLGYADADYQNLLNDLGGLEVYKESFQKTYKALLK
ncbi:MAG: hypothetical protein VSS75_034770, partial [Candidatus Parabeggiatoa sp.]|nr:hypothetical protein [Candidatus Parabeggiatoa sp.]